MNVQSDTRPYIVAGLIIVLLMFGGLGTWAAVSPLRGAVVAPGIVVVETNRKTVQHLEGGIVADLRVREGDVVRQGDVLISLDATRVDTQLGVIDGRLLDLRAREARLVAERDHAAEISFPADLLAQRANPNVEETLRGQTEIFRARRATLDGAVSVLKERIAQLDQEIKGLESQRAAKTRQLSFIRGELRDLKGLFEKGLVPRPRILALEREAARLDGERGQHVAEIARARKAIGETELRVVQLQKNTQEEVMSELRQAQARIFDLRERRVLSEDQQRRIDIRAPQSGRVLELSVHTIGAVIAPGQELMQIVPEADRLVVEAQVRPQDVDKVLPDMSARVRLSAFDLDTTPELDGAVTTVSADRVTDAVTQAPYFAARVVIPVSQLEKLGDLQLRAGMPAEVFIQTGSRTALSYLMKPFEDALHRVLTDT